MKLSLILNVIDPRIGGVMVMGERGTGKTTAVRALADLLPQIRVRGHSQNYRLSASVYACMSKATAKLKQTEIPRKGHSKPIKIKLSYL